MTSKSACVAPPSPFPTRKPNAKIGVDGSSEEWFRRITQEHRLVCRVTADRVDFLQARYPY